MPVSDAQKRASNKYIAEYMTVLGCKVRKDYADRVREKARDKGVSVNFILRKALDAFLESD